jgi:uncharacterized protein (TIGR02453 family)
MSDPTDLQPVLEFLKGLQKNNNKAWFDKHRPAYEEARNHFEAFVDELIVGLGALEDLGGVTAKDSVMRIYRDIRFSPDKSPYKTHMAASIGPGGRKAPGQKYYLHIEPHDASIVAGGLHDPDSAQLSKFRAAIGREARRFKSTVSHADFKRFFGAVEGEKLKTSPQGFDRNHPEIELLRLKSVVAVHRLPDKEVLSPKFGEHAIQAFTAMKPFLDYLNSVLD